MKLLELKGITKHYPGVTANDAIDLTLNPGEVLGLLGENGAGKSTLMNILYGLTRPDQGQILLNGQPVQIANPAQAIRLGIGMVHQHFMLIPVMTVSENMVLGNEPVTALGTLDRTRIRDLALTLSSQYGLEIDPDAVVSDLPVGVQQRVEILKALCCDAKILILDEPTAVLTPQETEGLFEVIENLKSQGKSIIFITHKLKEVIAVADRIMILRNGRNVAEVDPRTASLEALAELMVGRQVNLNQPSKSLRIGSPLLEVHHLGWTDRKGIPRIRDISLTVRAGEIVGIAGVQGNGQSELAALLTGMLSPQQGSIHVKGLELTGCKPGEFFRAGVGHIPEDRHRYGVVKNYSLVDNFILRDYRSRYVTHRILIDRKAATSAACSLIQTFDIRAPDAAVSLDTLSGGNQQKVVAARELSAPLSVLIAAHPTRGLDIGSIEFIHQKIIEKRQAGTAVVLISTELDEILELSDRIAVMLDGRIVAELPNQNIDRTLIGRLMGGESTALVDRHERLDR